MSLRNTAIAIDDEADPVRGAVAILERQLADTLELAAHVERLRTDLAADANEKVRSLLEGLSDELDACRTLFTTRIESFALDLRQPQQSEASRHSHWELFAVDGFDCRERLEGLLGGYAYYVRESSDSLAKLERLSDLESARFVCRAIAAAEKGLWFIDLYIAVVVLRKRTVPLADWPHPVV